MTPLSPLLTCWHIYTTFNKSNSRALADACVWAGSHAGCLPKMPWLEGCLHSPQQPQNTSSGILLLTPYTSDHFAVVGRIKKYRQISILNSSLFHMVYATKIRQVCSMTCSLGMKSTASSTLSKDAQSNAKIQEDLRWEGGRPHISSTTINLGNYLYYVINFELKTFKNKKVFPRCFTPNDTLQVIYTHLSPLTAKQKEKNNRNKQAKKLLLFPIILEGMRMKAMLCFLADIFKLPFGMIWLGTRNNA